MSVLEVVRRLHVYNQWANDQTLSAMAGLTPDNLMAVAPVAYRNLRGALWHTLAAQMLRIIGHIETWSSVPVRDSSSLEGLREMFDGSHKLWREYIASLTEDDALRPLELPIDDNFRRSTAAELLNWSDEHGHRPRRPAWQTMLHVVNHSTQHRAEVGMYLHSVDRSPGDLDYGTFEEERAVSESQSASTGA
jgi:uncharacterized damage-inducible protein DinB